MVRHIQLIRLECAGHICTLDGSRTPRKILERQIECSRPAGKSKDWRIDTVIWNVRKMRGTFLRPENLIKKNLGFYNRKLDCYAKIVVAVKY